MIAAGRTGAAAAAALALWLTGCTSFGERIPETLAPAVELEDTAFYPQLKHHCGPAALATVLESAGTAPAYDQVVDQVYIPELEGSLQVELMAAARGFGRIPFRIAGDLESVLTEVQAGHPVLILQNLGARSLSAWHYAVVIGHDRDKNRILMRSGTEQRLAVPTGRWLRQWGRAGRWAIVVLEPGRLPATVRRSSALRALADFDDQADGTSRLPAWQAAVKQWPDEPLVWMGRGNARYSLGQLESAAEDFEQALATRPDYWPARLNLARVLHELGQACRGLAVLAAQAMQFDHPLVEAHAELALQLDRDCSVSTRS